MTLERDSRTGVMAWLQVNIGRPGYVIAFVGLCTAATLHVLGQGPAARGIFAVVFALLVALPAANALGFLVEETRQKEWAFVTVALGVLGMLAWRIAG